MDSISATQCKAFRTECEELCSRSIGWSCYHGLAESVQPFCSLPSDYCLFSFACNYCHDPSCALPPWSTVLPPLFPYTFLYLPLSYCYHGPWERLCWHSASLMSLQTGPLLPNYSSSGELVQATGTRVYPIVRTLTSAHTHTPTKTHTEVSSAGFTTLNIKPATQIFLNPFVSGNAYTTSQALPESTHISRSTSTRLFLLRYLVICLELAWWDFLLSSLGLHIDKL